MGIDVPCYNCTERQYGCHGTCLRYIQYKEKIDEKNKRIEALRLIDGIDAERATKIKQKKQKRGRRR